MTAEPDTTGAISRIDPVTSVARVRARLLRVFFGDLGGVFVFLVSICVMMLLWRFQFTINDNYTLGNGLLAIADGHLYVTEPVYSDTLATPGMVESDGRAYPRNIGQLVVSLPVLLVMRTVTNMMDLHVAVAAGWSLVLMGTCITAGRLLEYDTAGRLFGAGIALAAFIASLLLADPAQLDHYALPALQVTTLLLAAFLAVILYRLCRHAYDRRVGLAAGLATGLATPTLLWATIPKRHVPIATLAVCSLYLLYRSRTAETARWYRRFRFLAYVPVGLSAWMFVGAGATLFIALAIADLASARENTLKTLAGIGVVVFISSIPFFITNYLISGNPLTSPIMLPGYEPTSTSTGAATSSGSATTVKGASADSPLPVALQQIVYFLGEYTRGLTVVFTDPGRLNTIFIRSGWYEELSQGFGAVNLSFTESMPLVGALVGLPVVFYHRLRARSFAPIHAVDAFVLLFSLLTLLMYITRLPLHAMITVRYLFALFPLSVYALVRLPWIRAVVHSQGRLLAWTYSAGVLIGGQLVLAWLVVIDAAFDEAMQAIALIGLGAAGLLAAWSLASATGREWPRAGAVLLGFAASSATTLYLIMVLYYYGHQFALPLVPT